MKDQTQKDKELLDFVEFVATKFQDDREGWVYSRDLGDLKHIRYESDYTGQNHWTRRVKQAFDLKYLFGQDSLSRTLGLEKRSLKQRVSEAVTWIKVSLPKEKNLPDGVINGIPTNWEEHGEYLMAMQPRVGAKVVEFLRAEPDNPHAKAILEEMHACVALSGYNGSSTAEADGGLEEDDEESPVTDA